MKGRVKCGVAGVGYLGSQHARLYTEIEGCELVGVYDLDRAKASGVAEKCGCRVLDSLEALGEACKAVSVVTPTTTHASVASVLLGKGCHLLIEKPLCARLAEANDLITKANAAQRLLQVGHVEHYNPVGTFLAENVRSPRYITAERLSPFNPRCTDVGVVLDLMIHDLGLVLQLVHSSIESIEAIGVNVLTENEDMANARIRFSDGCIANFNASRVSLKKVREIRVFQDNRYLSLDFIEQKGHLLFRGPLGLKKTDVPLEKKEPLRIELESFVSCVAKMTPPRVDARLGRSALDVALRITEAIHENRERG